MKPAGDVTHGELAGKIAVVTGPATGLGRAISVAYARSGAKVVLADIDEAGLAETQRRVVEAGAECLAVSCDVASSRAVADLFEKARTRFGTVDVLVNNAARVPVSPDDERRRIEHYAYLTTPESRRSLGFTSAMGDADWHRFWDVNVHGVFYCTREALKLMEPQRAGKIINIASIAGLSGYSAHSPHYSATKGAVIAFTRSVAAEVAGGNIFVNAIAPGGVHTEQFGDFLARIGEEKRRQLFQLVPLGRLGTPEEYASLAVYLAGDSHYLVGQVISPNGGMF